MQDAELVTENENLKLECRTAAERSQQGRSNADNTTVGENRRRVRSSHFISQAGICENHNLKRRLVLDCLHVAHRKRPCQKLHGPGRGKPLPSMTPAPAKTA